MRQRTVEITVGAFMLAGILALPFLARGAANVDIALGREPDLTPAHGPAAAAIRFLSFG